MFVNDTTWTGTWTANFTGPDCTGTLCFGDDCISQTFNISAGK